MGAAEFGAKRRRRAAKRRPPTSKFNRWSEVSRAEAAYFALIQRVSHDHAKDPVIDQLIHVGFVVRELWRALDRGENVDARARRLYRAATGRHDDTDAQRLVVAAIQRVARRTDAEIGALRGDSRRVPMATDAQITTLVCIEIRRLKDAAKRLAEHPVEVATAVWKWRRGRGRPKLGESAGSKWAAIAEVLRLAGLGKLDERAVKHLWTKHGFKIG